MLQDIALMQYPVGYVAEHVHQLYGLVQMPKLIKH
jgi:hypothetical protein